MVVDNEAAGVRSRHSPCLARWVLVINLVSRGRQSVERKLGDQFVCYRISQVSSLFRSIHKMQDIHGQNLTIVSHRLTEADYLCL